MIHNKEDAIRIIYRHVKERSLRFNCNIYDIGIQIQLYKSILNIHGRTITLLNRIGWVYITDQRGMGYSTPSIVHIAPKGVDFVERNEK